MSSSGRLSNLKEMIELRYIISLTSRASREYHGVDGDMPLQDTGEWTLLLIGWGAKMLIEKASIQVEYIPEEREPPKS